MSQDVFDREYARDLTESIHKIKVNTERLVTTVELVSNNIEKLEESVKNINNSLGDQERRITILEQLVSRTLPQDIVILKSNQESFAKFLWLIGGATITVFIHTVFKMMNGS